ncbi:hypothetical protein GCM10020370_25880 [Paenibacillus hodogayensis]
MSSSTISIVLGMFQAALLITHNPAVDNQDLFACYNKKRRLYKAPPVSIPPLHTASRVLDREASGRIAIALSGRGCGFRALTSPTGSRLLYIQFGP